MIYILRKFFSDGTEYRYEAAASGNLTKLSILTYRELIIQFLKYIFVLNQLVK